MGYTILLSPKAERQFMSLPAGDQARLAAAIDALAGDPRPAPPLGRKLQGLPPRYRLKLPPYRVVYQIDTKAKQVVVTWIGLRRDAYH